MPRYFMKLGMYTLDILMSGFHFITWVTMETSDTGFFLLSNFRSFEKSGIMLIL
jgi:hypothetical protein